MSANIRKKGELFVPLPIVLVTSFSCHRNKNQLLLIFAAKVRNNWDFLYFRSKFVNTMIRRAEIKDIPGNNITLNVWDGNDAALSFYKNMGMKVQKTTMEIVL